MLKVAALLQKILPAVWLGMICAIALEAQLKFQAPGITRELGLGIGKLVFTALNRIEISLAAILIVTFFTVAASNRARLIFALILLVLSAQTFWLLPDLIARIDLIVGGQNPPESSTHIIYIVLEVCKAALLIILSVLLNWRKN